MKTSRRDFIQKASLFTGVFTLGFDWFSAEASAETSAMEVVTGAGRFNAFLSIDSLGKVTLFSPNPEIGQGIKTAFPVVVAEELDVDWAQVQVEQANLDTKQFERQLTGGSGALKHSWERLRKAGATVRKMMLQAAADQWKVDVAQCKTSKGFVIGPAGQKASYGSLAEAASKLPVPSEVTFKDRKEYKIIGTRVKGVDNKNVVTGKPLFGIDIRKPGMVFAQIVRPPFGATLKSFSAEDVKKMPGILDVVSFKNKVAIVGENTYAILQARASLTCDYSSEAPLESNDTHQNWFDEGMKSDKAQVMRKDGDFAAAIASAAKVIEATYECPFISHSPMEPMNFFADVKADSVLLAGPTQVPQPAQKAVSDLLKIPVDKIQVELSKMGGGFGRRLSNDFVLEAAELSSIIKKPVLVMWTREDDMTGGTYRPAARYRFKAGLDKNYILEYNFGAGEWLSLVAPNAKGGKTDLLGNNEKAVELINANPNYYEYADILLNTDQSKPAFPSYWGGQSFSGGAFYFGVVMLFFFLMGLIFLKDSLKWPFLVIGLLAILLSSNDPGGINDFFINKFPMYNKFRDSKMIMTLLQVMIPALAVLFLDKLFRKEGLIGHKKAWLIGSASLVFVALILYVSPSLSGDFLTKNEISMFADQAKNVKDPSQLTYLTGIKKY